MIRGRIAAAAAVVVAAGNVLPVSAEGQALFPSPVAVTGMESRGYALRPGLGVRSVSQWSVPVVAVMPLGRRLSGDISTRWAHSRLTTDDRVEKLSGLTDTQVRVAYTLGAEQAVVSLVASLPTGKSSVSSDAFSVLGAVASDFLTLPVATYGTGAKLTGGVAAARSLGGINVGAGASVRLAASYEPFSDLGVTYDPGVETRLQLAADGLVGSGRLSTKLTFSTFGSDNFAGVGAVDASQTFAPGSRYILELVYQRPLGRGNLTAFAWNYHRATSQVQDLPLADSKQNIFDIGARWRVPVGRGVQAVPSAEIKNWTRDGASAGFLASFGMGLSIVPDPAFSLEPRASTDFGSVVRLADEERIAVQGWGLSLLARFVF